MPCGRCVRRALDIRLQAMPASVIKRSTRLWLLSRLTYTSTFTWKTTFFSRGRLKWNKSANQGTANDGCAGNTSRDPSWKEANSGGDLRDHSDAGKESLALADAIHLNWLSVHAPAGNIPRRLESAGDQQPPRREFGFCRMDTGTRACADLRLDRHVHPGHWVLF